MHGWRSVIFSNYRGGLVADKATDGFYHSSAFNKGFLIHDDAKLPYLRMDMGKDAVPSFEDVVAFIAPMPEKTFLPADTHQRLVRQLLLNGGKHSMSVGCPELAAAVHKKQIVLRNFLTTGTRYKESLVDRKGLPVPFRKPVSSTVFHILFGSLKYLSLKTIPSAVLDRSCGTQPLLLRI